MALVFHSRAYDLLIESELELPELTPTPDIDGVPDLTISLAQAIPDLSVATLQEPAFQVSPTAFRLSIEGVAVYQVEAGRRIQVQPVAGADPAQVRLFLLGSVLGGLLYQRGLFPLHGSAVETPWGAMVFVGVSGVGKSTLAAHFHRQGYRLLSDDVCAITQDAQGKMQVLPAFPQVRLCGDALGRLGERQAATATARMDGDKYILPLGDGYCPVAVPLGAVHVLTDAEGKPFLTALRGFDRIHQLAENLYRPHYLRGLQGRGEVLRLAGAIASSVEVFQFSRCRDAGQLDAQVHWLEDEWRSRSASSLAQDA